MHKGLPHAEENIRNVRDRHLIVVEQIHQPVHNHKMRPDGADELQQSVGDRNIQLIAGVRAADIRTVQHAVRIDAADARQFGKQIRVDAVGAVDEDDAPGMHQHLCGNEHAERINPLLAVEQPDFSRRRSKVPVDEFMRRKSCGHRKNDFRIRI